MTHIVIAFKQGTGVIIFRGTLEQAQSYQWSSANAAKLLAQGYTEWQLKEA